MANTICLVDANTISLADANTIYLTCPTVEVPPEPSGTGYGADAVARMARLRTIIASDDELMAVL